MADATFYKDGDMADYTPDADVAAGDIVDLGNGLVGVAHTAIAADELGSVYIEGIFAVRKASGTTIARGLNVEWDEYDAGAGVGLAVGSGGDYIIGIAAEAAVSGATTVKVKLNRIEAA